MATKIQIAPNRNEVRVTDNSITTDWHNKPRYNANLKALREKFGDDYLAESFSMAIALSSYDWQLEKVLNQFFKLTGHVDHANA